MAAQAAAPFPLVLVAHHAPDTVRLLRSLLEREGFTVLCAYNGRVARQYARQHQPALLLLDQALPLMDGMELCRALRGESDAPAIFILSDRPDELNKLLAFSAGADDYLQIPMHPRELLARVKAALRRVHATEGPPPSMVRCGVIELDPERRQARAAGREVSLTALEFELLAIFARHPGRVFSREDLLGRLERFVRGEPFDRAVDIHISNLRRKLRQALGEKTVVETVRGVGYRLRAEATTGASACAVQPSEPDGASLGYLALAALKRAPMPLLVLSPERTVLLYNEAAQHLCGWTLEEVAGQVKCYSLLGCHSADGALLCHELCPMRQARRNGLSDHQAHYVITLKDGRELPVAAHYTHLTDAGATHDCTLLALQPEPAPRA